MPWLSESLKFGHCLFKRILEHAFNIETYNDACIRVCPSKPRHSYRVNIEFLMIHYTAAMSSWIMVRAKRHVPVDESLLENHLKKNLIHHEKSKGLNFGPC